MSGDDRAGLAVPQAEPTLAEDLMLVLFQPGSGPSGTGVIAAEGVLLYALAGAVLAELGMRGHVRAEVTGGVGRVRATDAVPADPLLRRAWDYVAQKPRGVQTVLAAVGPQLREPVLERLVARGDIERGVRRAFGLFETRVLEGDGGERRAALVAAVRAVLVDGEAPSERVGALAALVSASGALPQLHREIPWGTAVAVRAKELEQGNWGADAAAQAVARTMTAIIVGNVTIAAAVLPKG